MRQGIAALVVLLGFSSSVQGEALMNPVNDFACSMYRQLATASKDGNVFFSPFSMESALAMTAEGARGQTAQEMARVLGAPAETLHPLLSEVGQRLADKPVPPDLRERIAKLRAELDEANARLRAIERWSDAAQLHERAEQVAAELNGLLNQVDQYEFRAANALWGEKSFTFEKPYLDTIAKFYKSGGFFEVDFQSNSEGAQKQINAWIAQQTSDRIKDLIKAGMLGPDTRLVLTNGVYFKGEWSDPFDARATKDEDFTTSDGSKRKSPLMHKYGPEGARYAAFNADGSIFNTPTEVVMGEEPDPTKVYPGTGGFLALELPYKGGDISTLVLLPQSHDGLAKLESKLTGANIAGWMGALQPREVDVFLPKFTLETDYDLGEHLQAMGMKRAFVNPANPSGAEFDGISASTDPRQRLFISAVVHKAFLEVNEKGTEAAAVTAVMAEAGSAMPQTEPFNPTFRADHPFILLIRESKSGTILFLGRVTRPG